MTIDPDATPIDKPELPDQPEEVTPVGENAEAAPPKMSIADMQRATMMAAIKEIKLSNSVQYTRHQQNKFFAFDNQQVANSPYHLVKGLT